MEGKCNCFIWIVLPAYFLLFRESDFFDLVLKYGGAEHFDSDRTCPYRYATVLFCCQRFGDAIAYLWAANALIPAAHLTVVCLHYGLILPHMPLTQNPAHALVSNRTVGVSNDPTPAYLLQTFIDATVFCTLPKIAVDYLVSLDSNWLTFAQGMDSEYRDACRLKSQAAVSTALENFIISLRQDQLADVVGILQATPYNRGQFNQRTGRSAGRLDDYLDSKQIESLLARIAYHLLTQRGDAEGAIYLYQLGGRFVEATEELCNQLAKHMIGGSVRSISRDVSSLGVSGREKWRAAGQKYASEHFDNSTSNPSIVLASLEHGGKVDLVETLYILLQLYSFVDLYNEGRHGDAIDLMDTLRIIPVDEESVELLQGMMRPFLRIVADDLLLMSMDCIRNVMGAVKAERIRTGGNIGILTDRDFMYQQLTNRAKAIVHFAHKIQARLNRRDTLSSLARTEAMLE